MHTHREYSPINISLLPLTTTTGQRTKTVSLVLQPHVHFTYSSRLFPFANPLVSRYSCPSLSTTSDMISRRRILSRSRDDLNSDSGVGFAVQVEEEEDVWYNKDKLYKVRLFCALSTAFTKSGRNRGCSKNP